MLKIEFSAGEKQALNYERYNHPHPRVRRKMEVLWLKSQNISHNKISELADISILFLATIFDFIFIYNNMIVKDLLDFKIKDYDAVKNSTTVTNYSSLRHNF